MTTGELAKMREIVVDAAEAAECVAEGAADNLWWVVEQIDAEIEKRGDAE